MFKIMCSDGISRDISDLIISGSSSTIKTTKTFNGTIILDVQKNSQDRIQLREIENGSPGCILVTDTYGTASWQPIEQVIGKLIENPTIRSRIENVIAAQKELEMTIKLCE